MFKKIDKQLFKNTIMLYVLKVVTIIFPLITFPYLTRVLGTSAYGELVFSISVVTYLKILVEFGFGLFGTRQASLHRNDKIYLSRLFTKISIARFLLVIVSSILLILLLVYSKTFITYRNILIISFIQLFPLVLGSDFIFFGQEKMTALTTRAIIANLIYTLIVLIFVKNPKDVYIVPIAAFVSNVFIVSWSYMYISRKFKIKLMLREKYDIFGIIKTSAPFFLASLSTIVFTTGNIFFLGTFGFSTYEIGLFGAATNLVVFIRSFFSPISDSLYPYMVKNKDFKLIKTVLFLLMPLIIIGSSILFVFSDFFITLFSGNEYIQSSDIFRLYVPLIVITLPIYLLGFPTLGALGKLNSVNRTVLIAAIVHLVLLFTLYFTGNLTIISITIVTVISESLVLLQRIIIVYFNKYGGKYEAESSSIKS